jgi:probable HAF family extracellular repeat protein
LLGVRERSRRDATAIARICTRGGSLLNLGALGGTYSQAYGLNDAGQIAGIFYPANSGLGQQGFLYSDGVMTDIGTLGGNGGTAAYGINASADVVGASFTSGNASSHAFVYSGGTMTDIGTLGGSDLTSVAYGVNNAGQVVGSSTLTNGSGTCHAFLYSGSVMADLGTLGGSDSEAWGVNNSGQVVGDASTAGGAAHAFLYSGGVMTDLGTLGGNYSEADSEALGINDAGQIVGDSLVAGNITYDAFLYSGGVMTDLNSLLPVGSGWQLSQAFSINGSGQIVGDGLFDGQPAAFLLDTSESSSSPEPCSLALVAAGVGFLALVRKRP